MRLHTSGACKIESVSLNLSATATECNRLRLTKVMVGYENCGEKIVFLQIVFGRRKYVPR